jgi:hypothetical protein
MTLKVIGAGYGRTGTMSLKLALEQLGFGPCYHMVEVFKNPSAPDWWREAALDPDHADWEKIFAGYSATVDWPNATYWRELAAAYPDAKLILTERDPDIWFDSTQATIFANDLGGENPTEPFPRMLRKVVAELFDGRLHDRAHCIAVFEAHNRMVRETIPPERLLVYELAQGWEPLCGFLGVAAPQDPMPKVNSRENFVGAPGRARSGTA